MIARTISEVLTNNDELSSIIICYQRREFQKNFESLMLALSKNLFLEHLELIDLDISDEQAITLAKAIEPLKKLHTLKLINNNIGKSGYKNLIASINKNKCLKYLALDKLFLSFDDGLVSTLLKKNKFLLSFEVNNYLCPELRVENLISLREAVLDNYVLQNIIFKIPLQDKSILAIDDRCKQNSFHRYDYLIISLLMAQAFRQPSSTLAVLPIEILLTIINICLEKITADQVSAAQFQHMIKKDFSSLEAGKLNFKHKLFFRCNYQEVTPVPEAKKKHCIIL